MNTDIWIVYCAEDAQYSVHIPYYQGITAMDALQQAQRNSLMVLPTSLQLGVFGLKIDEPAHYVLNAGDRLEVYRSLKMNPKDVRRKRAEKYPVGRFQRGNQWRKQQKNTD